MNWLIQNRHKSQLGQILVGKKLISEDQLARAIQEQGRSGQRLGEILAAWKLITEAQVRLAIRRQRKLRLAATVATALLGPLHACLAVAAAPAAIGAPRAPSAERGALRPLSDEELGDVAAQGRGDDALREHARRTELRLAELAARAGQAASGAALVHGGAGEGVQVLGDLARVFHPLSMLLGGQVGISDVEYDPANSSAVLNKDGSMTLRLPSTIGEISFKNIRVGSAASGPSFGSIDIRNIDLRGAADLCAAPASRDHVGFCKCDAPLAIILMAAVRRLRMNSGLEPESVHLVVVEVEGEDGSLEFSVEIEKLRDALRILGVGYDHRSGASSASGSASVLTGGLGGCLRRRGSRTHYQGRAEPRQGCGACHARQGGGGWHPSAGHGRQRRQAGDVSGCWRHLILSND